MAACGARRATAARRLGCYPRYRAVPRLLHAALAVFDELVARAASPASASSALSHATSGAGAALDFSRFLEALFEIALLRYPKRACAIVAQVTASSMRHCLPRASPLCFLPLAATCNHLLLLQCPRGSTT